MRNLLVIASRPQAEDILRSHGLYALPVVGQREDNADKLLGLITRAEISKAFRVRLLCVAALSVLSLLPSFTLPSVCLVCLSMFACLACVCFSLHRYRSFLDWRRMTGLGGTTGEPA